LLRLTGWILFTVKLSLQPELKHVTNAMEVPKAFFE
jgi:hypothetical protein